MQVRASGYWIFDPITWLKNFIQVYQQCKTNFSIGGNGLCFFQSIEMADSMLFFNLPKSVGLHKYKFAPALYIQLTRALSLEVEKIMTGKSANSLSLRI